MQETYLAHHGILGMKWGVRRTPEQLGHRKKSSEEHDALRAKKAEEMTTDELKKNLERARLEKEYEGLTASAWKKGRQKAQQMLADSGSVFVKTAVAGVAGVMIKKYVTDKILNGTLVIDGKKAVATAALVSQLALGKIRS